MVLQPRSLETKLASSRSNVHETVEFREGSVRGQMTLWLKQSEQGGLSDVVQYFLRLFAVPV
jgi:hypothetical protein